MNVTLTSLEALILKATHDSEEHPEEASVNAFCAIMRDSADGYQLGAQALAARIHSSTTEEAILALEMVNFCIRKDAKFLAEIGKFRFLNELIKLVSPRYLASRTPLEVQRQVLQYINEWAFEFTKEKKIKIAYDMLKSQGVAVDKPRLPVVNHSFRDGSLVIDEGKSKLLQKLLQSKKPDDLDYANKMIKSMVREEERRCEANCRRAQEVNAAYHCVGLLTDMLKHGDTASDEEVQLIHELHTSCRRQNIVMQDLIARERDPTKLGDIIHVSGLLSNVDFEYETFRKRKVAKADSEKAEMANGDDRLLDFNGPGKVHTSGASSSTTNTLAELGDIFSSPTVHAPVADLLKPVPLAVNEDGDKCGEASIKTEGWMELDSLGEQLMKMSLPENAKRADGFTSSKTTKKIPMNALEKVTLELNSDPMTSTSNGRTDLDLLIDCDPPLPAPREAFLFDTNLTNRLDRDPDACLQTIHLSIESVQPSSLPPLTLFEEDQLTAVLHFAKDKPLHNVYVVILTMTNKDSVIIEDYEFKGAVSKDSGIRILSPSSRTLTACTVFTPPSALTQLLLIRTSTRVTLTYALSYTRLGHLLTHAVVHRQCILDYDEVGNWGIISPPLGSYPEADYAISDADIDLC